MSVKKSRDIWVDNVKVVACILVVLGHFFQSMVKSGLMPNSFTYNWFENTIYYFHVPLFFICSGFLYQKYSRVNDYGTWKNNILKKLVALGVPYFVFSFATWLLKKIFSSSVNTELGGLGETLFKHPASPYWYLYILFIIFIITVTTNDIKKQCMLFFVAMMLKVLSLLGVTTGLYFVDKTMANWIWFVFGMILSYGAIRLSNKILGFCLFILFIIGSLLIESLQIESGWYGFLLAMLACYSIISVIYSIFEEGVQSAPWGILAKYTMPVFLMHTLFAAPLRSVLLKLGVNNLIVHVVLGLCISFAGPVVAMILLEKLKPLDFVIYPGRYIKFNGRK